MKATCRRPCSSDSRRCIIQKLPRANEERWAALWRRLRARGDGLDTWRTLRASYTEAARAYHNLIHIDECLGEFDDARHLAAGAVAVEVAIWFHDVVYDSRGKENEERSAAVWHRVADSAGLDDPLRARVTDLILATKHAAPPIDSDAKLIVDVDLTILGQPAKRFDEYERQIRDEYAWVEPAAFTAGRGKVLTAFIGRGSIYFTEHFRAKYEAQARENLRRSLERLGRALSP